MLKNSHFLRILNLLYVIFINQLSLTSTHANWSATTRCYFFYFLTQRELDQDAVK